MRSDSIVPTTNPIDCQSSLPFRRLVLVRRRHLAVPSAIAIQTIDRLVVRQWTVFVPIHLERRQCLEGFVRLVVARA